MKRNKDKNIEISIITVNYHGYKDTCQMIESIRKHVKSVTYEIIVVNNSLTRDELYMLKQQYPFIETIQNHTNNGFAGGNNLGSLIASGKYLFFLNNDTIIKDDSLVYLIETLESSEEIGGVSPMICYAENNLIQYAGFTPLTGFTLRNHSIGNGQTICKKYQRIRRMPYLHGAAMMIKKHVYDKIGPMPEMYFLYYEEFDYCLSIARQGYSLYYDPRCIIYHKESQSTGQNSPLRTYYLTRNRMLFAYRNQVNFHLWVCLLYLTLIVAPKDCIKHLFNKRIDLAKATLMGVYDYYKLKKEEKLNH